MRLRLIPFALSAYLLFFGLGCNKNPSTSDNNSNNGNAATNDANATSGKEPGEGREARAEKKREPIVVPAGTSITISLGSALGSKLSPAGSTFNGSVAKNVMARNEVAIPKGVAVAGTVTDAKPLGKFAGGAVLNIRLDSITLNGAEVAVQASPRTFSAKGKGKRTAVIAGGGAAVGGIIGALAGGGKGAAIGMAAGGGAGAGGAALTGNKDIVLPAESAVSFELAQPLEIKR